MSHKRNGEYRTPKDEWGTPDWLFRYVSEKYNLLCDVAAKSSNKKTRHVWFGPDQEDPLWRDALKISNWMEATGVCGFFNNPPYTLGKIDLFMEKSLEQAKLGARIVCLVPAATDTRWWHNYAMKAAEIRFIKGRVKYIGYDAEGNPIRNSPAFASCVVIFQHDDHEKDCLIDKPRIGETIEQPRQFGVCAA